MIKKASTLKIVKSLLAMPRMALAKPGINWFLIKYLQKFKVQDVAGQLFVHSHLPALNSRAYKRFVIEHLLGKSIGPAYAQIAITNACPQNCTYCYNKNRTGQVMNIETILRVVRELQELGVFWLGLTGGEPLLNKDIVKIVESAAKNCTVKLFTTGCTLTKEKAKALQQAGLASVSVSLDHWLQERHDHNRNYPGAFRTALNAIDIFKQVEGLHVGVSAVLSKEMLKPELVEEFLQFLAGLDIHEAWLSETKPSVTAFQDPSLVITPEEKKMLMDIQDRYNKQGGMTVNYLGHFEDAQHFGCTAGHKMIYIDAFGETSPCVFIPMTFGNVQKQSVKEIYQTMRLHFPCEDSCFINRNYPILSRHAKGRFPINREDSLQVMPDIKFGPLSKFFQLHYERK